jgi:hypothetical protein
MTSNTPELPSGHGEALLRTDTIDAIHNIRDHYLSWDRNNDPPKKELPFPRRHYIIEALENDAIPPIQHHRLAMTPIPGKQPIGGIKLVYFRMPTPYYEKEARLVPEEGEFDRQPTPQWNDIFIELLGDDERPLGKYLLNGAGLSRYEKVQTADDVETDIIRNYQDYEETGNFFIAGDEPEPRGDLPTFDIYILQEILQNYVPLAQTNEI